MNRRAAGVLVALAGLVIVAGALGWIRASRRPAPVAPAPGAAVQAGDAPPETLERRTVTLTFAVVLELLLALCPPGSSRSMTAMPSATLEMSGTPSTPPEARLHPTVVTPARAASSR